MTTEFLHEHHSERKHEATARLSTRHHPLELMFVQMTSGTVEFHHLVSKHEGKSKSFKLTADEAQAFVDAWMQFQLANSAYEQELLLKKEQEELQEAERRGKVWLEVDQLAHSVPGMEIIAKEDTNYNYDTGEYDDVTKYDVKLTTLGYDRDYLQNVDQVLKAVKELVSKYNQYVQRLESYETANWYGLREQARQDMIEFLAAHRAFVAEQQKHREEVVQAAQQQ